MTATNETPGLNRPATIALNRPLTAHSGIGGGIVEEGGIRWYRVEGTERMEPFLMSLTGCGDQWLFILSTGALTAGRKDPDHALFPYYTQDKMRDMASCTGSRTVILLEGAGERPVHWEPFSTCGRPEAGIHRSVMKSELGNCIILEEEHTVLGLKIRVSWRACDRFGFVRKVELQNVGEAPCRLRVLDGLQNVLPSGLSQRFQNEFSILGDAYKKNERVAPGNIGIFHLSSVPTDLALPKEALKTNVVWQSGLEGCTYLLTDTQLAAFRNGEEIREETVTRGRRGSFLAGSILEIQAGKTEEWYTIADVDREAGDILTLSALLEGNGDILSEVEAECRFSDRRLRQIIGQADGFQCTEDGRRVMRHTSNTLFNLMRGGALFTGYTLPESDLLRTVACFNREAAQSLEQAMEGLSGLNCRDPWDSESPIKAAGKDAVRLLREYLPLSFSRRHGDPSRPWNRFSIEIEEDDGSPRFYYQGNWRDIFQNWEALLQSWPEYTEAAIFRFLNASTADGYNPYRLTKDGFEWEVMEPSDDWANIGYWGDHQIIYLLRLLETSVKYHPGRLEGLLAEDGCVYAEIPYRIRHYDRMLEDPRETIDYDDAWADRIEARVARKGSDGKLMHLDEGSILYVTLMEKLLAPLLAKLSNFVPGGGIWMNTQRPEWNDANNALVGYGISVVTLGYVHRYLMFLEETLGSVLQESSIGLSKELASLLRSQAAVFQQEETGPLDAVARKAFMDRLSRPASAYRETLYENGLTGEREAVDGRAILDYLQAARKHVRQSLMENRRDDALWHSYNLLELGPEGIGIHHLNIMLEGQVSILSARLLDTGEAMKLLVALRESPLYREDQESYILYPDKKLPEFLEKNRVPESRVQANPVLRALVESGDSRIIRRRNADTFSFNGNFHNGSDLKQALGKLKEEPGMSGYTAKDFDAIADLFESVFNHRAFTGRSGTFFAYEGLGSIYWHMVSKLVLAVQEIIMETDPGNPEMGDLIAKYKELRDGIGVHKDPARYGAIPTDAYSHTPAHTGAQQPGMTGQVKEDFLIRMAEMGIQVRDGSLRFNGILVPWEEQLTASRSLPLETGAEDPETVEVPSGSMAFTFCGVPVVYHKDTGKTGIRLTMGDGKTEEIPLSAVPGDLSRELFKRTGHVTRIDVTWA